MFYVLVRVFLEGFSVGGLGGSPAIMEGYFDNDLKDVWEADIDPVRRPCVISVIV